MKKLLAIVLLAAVALTLWGCTPVNDGQASEEALTSTLASIQEMTEKFGREAIESYLNISEYIHRNYMNSKSK